MIEGERQSDNEKERIDNDREGESSSGEKDRDGLRNSDQGIQGARRRGRYGYRSTYSWRSR